MPTTAEQEIYSRLTSAPIFHPANAVLFQRDWTLEPGDVVTVNSGEDSYSVPIYALKLNWMGSDQSTSANADRIKASIESTGNEKREPLPELRRKEYQTARSSYGYYRAQQQEIDEHYRHLTETTDRGMAEAFGIIGVKLGPDGMPMKDANGNYIWDDSGTGGEIWGHLNHDAWSTQIMHHIKDENGNILSLGEVYTDAYGNVLINAINGEGSGELKINADRIAIQSTSGSGITFDTDGNISINAVETVSLVNEAGDQIFDTTGGTISLNGSVVAASLDSQEIACADLTVSGDIETVDGDLTINGDMSCDGSASFEYVAASSLSVDGSDVSGAIFDLRIVAPAQGSNTYTLQKKSFSDSDWENVGTFSRATTLSGAWSSGVYTVTASPQGNTESTQIYIGATGNGSSNFSVNTYHDSIAAANIAISDYIYLTEEVAAKTVSARWHNAQGTAYGVISTQATYNAGWGAAYGKVDLPDPLTGLESNDTLTMDVKVPAQTVGTDATTTYTLSATQWNGNTAFAKLKAGNDDILRLTLDATPRYYAGSSSVTLNNPDWGTAPSPLTANRTVSVSTSGRVDSNGTAANLTKDIALYLTQGSFDSAHKMIVGLQSSGAIRAQTEVDASGIYSDGQDSVSARIRSDGGSVVSGTLSLTPGQHITLYPSKKIDSSFTDITDYGVEVIAPTDSGNNVTLVNDDTSITATTASTDQIHFLGRRDNADSRTQIDVEVGVTLSNGKRYSRWITQINTGMTFAGRQNMYVYDSVDRDYVDIGVHDWFYKN